MVLIETNIDDMTGEMLGYARDKLLEAGAADVWFSSIQMKKGRPGVMLSVICREAEEEAVARLLLRETSTLGVRVRPVHRWEAEREMLEFESSLGPAAVKVKRLAGRAAARRAGIRGVQANLRKRRACRWQTCTGWCRQRRRRSWGSRLAALDDDRACR